MNKKTGFLSILVPSATVFLSSACIMILELVASRLVAKHLGSSLYTWTSVIGVVLAGITIGNYLGGRIADRFAAKKALSVLFVLSSVACVIVVILNNMVGEWIWLWHLSWPVRTFTHVSFVFLFPSILLGTISPVVAKMALDQGLATGRTVGDIYACGAAGSIAGTFVTGYYLIAVLGTIAIVWLVGIVLLLLAILYWARLWVLYLWAVVFVALMTMGIAPAEWAQEAGANIRLRKEHDANILYEDESQYCYVAVRQVSKKPDRRVFMQDKLKHSEIVMEDINDLRYFYTHIYAGLTHGLSKNKEKLKTLTIGGGGYAYPQYIEKNWPGSQVDVVEIDPGVTKAAIEAFGLSRYATIRTFNMDARNYVDELLAKRADGKAVPKYDFIYEDAINDYSVPFQLVTREFNEKIIEILADDGVYMVNLIDMYDNGQFLGAVVNTIKETFPFVHVLSSYVSLPMLRDTFVVAASKQPFDPKTIFSEYNPSLKLRYFNENDIAYLRDKSREIVLTDDYAPVENLLAPVVSQSANEILARKYLGQAQKLKQDQSWNKAIAKFERAVELNPSMSLLAYNEIGLIYFSQGNLNEAVKNLQKAIEFHQDHEKSQNVVGSIYLNLGVLFDKMGKKQQAIENHKKAIEQFRLEIKEQPKSDLIYWRLGSTFATIGDFKSASEAFRKAIELKPGNLSYYDDLAKSLEFQGRYDEAIGVVKKQVNILKRIGQNQVAAKISEYIEFLEYKKTKNED